jgi:energy-coupling factor transporter ATP-binding protein EcfA2
MLKENQKMAQNQNKNQEYPEWVQALLRQAPICRALVLYGNVQDTFYDPEQRQYVTLPELLTRIFTRNKALGYSMTGVWDQVDGLRFPDQQMLARFRKAVAGKSTGNNTAAQAYDLGEQNNTQAANSNNRLYPDPADLMAAIRPLIDSTQERPAFIIDYSQLLITQPDHPDQTERNWMLQMAKAVTGPNIVSMNSDNLRHNGGLIVLLATNLGKIPPILYQGDPRVKVISVPTPARPQRKSFFLRHTDDLRCQRPKAADSLPVAQTAGAGQAELADTLADLTDQLKINDLRQILSLSLNTEAPLPPEKLLNLYRFGDQRSPWEELSEEKLKNVDEILKKRVVGQDAAVDHVGTTIIRANMGLAGLQHSGKRTKPKGTMFFVGPTGVGKTELAKACAEFLFGDESACIRFDMSEYNHEHSDQRLVGAPPGYVGFEEGGQLTNAVRERPFSVFLFDEIEKAHGRILDKFLQVLEDGRLTDGRGETSHFSESVIIFTSNIGSSDMPQTDDPEENRQHFLQAVENHFVTQLKRPELLNRLGDNIVVFNKITDNSFRRSILERKLSPLKSYLKERFGVNVQLSEDTANGFLENSKIEHGGRGLLNIVERRLINPLARFLFERTHQLRRGRTISVTLKNNEVHFDLQEDTNNV